MSGENTKHNDCISNQSLVSECVCFVLMFIQLVWTAADSGPVQRVCVCICVCVSPVFVSGKAAEGTGVQCVICVSSHWALLLIVAFKMMKWEWMHLKFTLLFSCCIIFSFRHCWKTENKQKGYFQQKKRAGPHINQSNDKLILIFFYFFFTFIQIASCLCSMEERHMHTLGWVNIVRIFG